MAGLRVRAVCSVSKGAHFCMGAVFRTYLSWRHHILWFGPLRLLRDRVVIIDASVGGSMFLPRSSPRPGEWRVHAVHCDPFSNPVKMICTEGRPQERWRKGDGDESVKATWTGKEVSSEEKFKAGCKC